MIKRVSSIIKFFLNFLQFYFINYILTLNLKEKCLYELKKLS